MPKKRDTYKYYFKDGKRIKHAGITTDLERREKEHQKGSKRGHIYQVGRRTTDEAARQWEERQMKVSRKRRRMVRKGV